MPNAPAVPPRILLAYGAPILGLGFLMFFVQFYFLKFATDVLLLPPATVGVVFAVAKVWDAISNPLVGSWSDRTRSRLGRRRPFLFGSLPLLVLGFVMLWRPPEALSPGLLVAWMVVGLFLFYVALALYTIPHVALGAEMSSDSHQRTRLFGARQIFFTIGMLCSFAAIQSAMNAASPRVAAAAIAIPSALIAVLLLSITPLALREPARACHGGQSMMAGFRDVLGSRAARILLFVWFVENTGVGAVGTLAPYVAQYVLRRPDVVGILPAAYVVSGILTIPLWIGLSRRIGARDTWLAAMILAAIAFGGMLFVGANDIVLTIALLALAGCSMGCGSVLSSTLMAEIIDIDERQTGERKEGAYSSAMMFVLRIGISLATAASGFVLASAGFVPNGEQSAASLMGIRILFAGMPCVGFLVGAFLFRRFPLGKRVAATVAVG